MAKARGKLIILLVLMSLVFGIFAVKLAGGLLRSVAIADTVGTPLVSDQEAAVVNASVTQVLETEDTLYLVYGYKSVVEAYSLDGAYLYTISVCNHLNGRTEIAYSKSEDVLYISDKHRNLYAFSGKDYLAFTDGSQSWDLYSKLKFGRSSPDYSVKAGAVWYTNGEKSRCVVQKPVWQAIYQSNVLDLLLFFLLILTGYVIHFPYRTKPK